MACGRPCASSRNTSGGTGEIEERFGIEEEMCETEGDTSEIEELSVEDALEEAIETFGETLEGETAFDGEEKMLEETHCLIS